MSGAGKIDSLIFEVFPEVLHDSEIGQPCQCAIHPQEKIQLHFIIQLV